MSVPLGLDRLFDAAAGRHGDRLGLSDDVRALSYAAAAAEVAALADVLRGLGPQPVVASMVENSVDGVILFAAISAAGGVNVCFEPRMRAEDVERALELTAPDLVVVDTRRPAGAAAARAAEHALERSGERPLADELAEAVARAAGRTAPRTDHEPGAILFTSGSTGAPKGVVKRERALWWNVVESTIWGARAATHTELFAIPLGHLNFWDIAMPAYWSGGGLHLIEGFSPERFVAAAERAGAASTCVTPGMIARVLDAGADRASLPSLRAVVLWGDLSDDLRHELVEAFGEIFRFCYGITEGSSFAAGTREFVTHPGACGTPVGYCSVEIRGEDGRALPRGEVGRMWMRTPTAYSGYIGAGDPAKGTREGEERFFTGDLAHLDDDGRVYIHAREGFAIKTGGLNVYPLDVEAVFARHEQVRSCVVVGVPDRRWGEAVVAVVEPKPDALLESDALLAFARERLAGYQCPKRVVVTDALPLMANGKYNRRQLVAELQAELRR